MAERGYDADGLSRYPDEAEIERVRARPGWSEDFARRHGRRTDLDIFSEAGSLVLLLPAAFLLALMLSSPVVSWSGGDRGPAAFALAAGVAAHFAANLIPTGRGGLRAVVRGVLLIAVLAPSFGVAEARHPYLLATGRDHRRLLAERVWSLDWSITAGRYASVLVDYAKDLETDARWSDAVIVYQRALELDAFLAEAALGLERARGRLEGSERGAPVAVANRPPGKGDDFVGVRPGRGESLPAFDWRGTRRLKICLVPVGPVPSALVDEAGRGMEQELGVEVFRWSEPPLALPRAGRNSAMLGHPQWEPVSLMQGFIDRLKAEAEGGRMASGAWQFLLVTNADLYAPDSNFVFATSFPVHGVVSFARFGGDTDARRADRLAKQLVATAIKCFGVKQAARPDCVTAYVRSLAELDRKPMRPAAETAAEYRRKVALWEQDPSREPERSR